MSTDYVQLSQFESDESLRLAIEDMFGYIWQDSKRAYEEYVQFKGFGLAMKPEGQAVYNVGPEPENFLKVPAVTYALQTFEEDQLPYVRACLFGELRARLQISGFTKPSLQMHWRRRPESYRNQDFDTATDKWLCVFRIGCWADRGPKEKGVLV